MFETIERVFNEAVVTATRPLAGTGISYPHLGAHLATCLNVDADEVLFGAIEVDDDGALVLRRNVVIENCKRLLASTDEAL